MTTKELTPEEMEALSDPAADSTWNPNEWKNWTTHGKWVNHAVPKVTEDEAKVMNYNTIKAILKYVTDDYQRDTECFDEMGWRKYRIYKYKGQKYVRGPLPQITHEELKFWKRHEEKVGFHDIARYCADTITGESVMNIMGLSTGPSGSGKSMGTCNILWGAGMYVADTLTGDPANWYKHFPFWRNIKVIDKDNFGVMFADLGYQSIKFGDDAFNALNRTKFMTQFSEEVGTIAATDRVFKDITFFSMQYSGMIDIIIRNLANVRIDFKSSPASRQSPKNLNMCKFHLLDINPYNKRNPIFNRLVHTRRMDVEDHFVGLPPDEILEQYNLVRLLGAVLMKRRPAKKDDEDLIELTPYDCHRCGKGDIYTGKDGVIKCKPCGMKWTVEADAQGGFDVDYRDNGVVQADGTPSPMHVHFNRGERFQFIKPK